MPQQSTLVTAAAVTGGVLLTSAVALARYLQIGAYSPKSALILGKPSYKPVTEELGAKSAPGQIVDIDIDTPTYSLQGKVDAAYLPVVDAFLANITNGHEVGAGFCLYVKGKPVIDLAGGLKDNGRKYDLTSVNQVFSSGKAIMSIVVAFCVSKGYLKYDLKVADVWPEFAQGGKEEVTVQDILQHRGGVGWLDDDNRLDANEFWETPEIVVEKLAKQKHNFDGKKTQSYHAATRGWYINEVLKRVHPKKYTAKKILDEEIMPLVVDKSDPHGFPVFVSVPETPEVMKRVWDLTEYPGLRVLLRLLTPKFMNADPLPEAIVKSIGNPNPIADKSLFGSTPKVSKPDPVTGAPPPKGIGMQNSWNIRRGEHTSFATLTNARTMARLAWLVCNLGEIDGVQVIDKETMKFATTTDPWVEDCKVLRMTHPWTHGGWAVEENQRFPHMPADDDSKARGKGISWSGWFGYGGSVIQWDMGRGIAFGYCPSALQIALLGDFRSIKLLDVALDCYEKASK